MLRSRKIELELVRFLEQAPLAIAPGLLIQAFERGQKIIDVSWGQTWSYYDLASLTKPLFSVMAVAWAYDQGYVDINAPIKNWFGDQPYEGSALLKNLLNHTSDFADYAPMFKDFDPRIHCGSPGIEGAIRQNLKQLLQTIFKLPRREPGRAIYSDLGFLLLIPILEQIYKKDLKSIWKDEVLDRFYPGVTGLHFCEHNCPRFQKELYAPTERCSWRGTLLQGEVHDEHAWLLGGVSTHAGLFGSIDDVSWAVLSLRAQMLGFGKKVLRHKTSQIFFQRSIDSSLGDWTLGLMLPTVGSSSSGQFFSENSVGHLGFTGCSFWFDPIQDIIVVLLSNRVYFGRDNQEFKKWRPLLHDKVYELLKKF
ncbi:MAG: beta-lactamase family protein [Bdellovibrionaceae bacterium]|nr:beta-lactamase family protein [Pseudobdellovibrionaceae bacterium]MDW8189621.1 serine hydrolase [Pseudobdellovibrionaceae bacterium]